jgi:L-serine dehydratase
MGENNACMGRIVAAPTAGSCGVLPAVLLTWQDLYEEKQERKEQNRNDKRR